MFWTDVAFGACHGLLGESHRAVQITFFKQFHRTLI
jgi:hypothetical protein